MLRWSDCMYWSNCVYWSLRADWAEICIFPNGTDDGGLVLLGAPGVSGASSERMDTCISPIRTGSGYLVGLGV